MQYKQLNNTSLKVSALCLGTVNYGTYFHKDNAFSQLDLFLERGGNFIDTAHVYGDWEAGTRGLSEQVLGQWMNKRQCRNLCVIATKGAHPRLENMDVSRVNHKDIEMDLFESLENLKTDYIDLYFLHRDDISVPVGEIIDLLDKLVVENKIHYYGCSNWSLKRIREAADYAIKKGSTGFVCNQLMWSLADVRTEGITDKTMIMMDMPTYEYHKKTRLNAMAYMSMAKGYFPMRADGIKLSENVLNVYKLQQNDKIFDKLLVLEKDSGVSVAEICLKYLMEHSFPSIPIASFDDNSQLELGIRSCDASLSHAIIEELHSMKTFIRA
jgi:aryl-alcohol dehydrogenase-like predicted oxidoreductase